MNSIEDDTPARAPTIERSIQALNAIMQVLDTMWIGHTRDAAPLYPESVPQLPQHISDLIAIAQTSDQCVGQASHLLGALVCAKCPYHYRVQICALRSSGECALHELAEPIVHAVRNQLAPHGSSRR